MKPVAAVLFDLYETLARADRAVLDEGRTALAARAGVEPARLLAEFERTQPARFRGELGGLEEEVRSVLAGCGVEASPALVAELAAIERATWSRGLQLYEDSAATLRALRRDGYRLGIVSNCGVQTAARVDELGLADQVDALVLSCRVGVLKPDPAIFELALAALAVPPERALFVDDLPVNLDAARQLGLRTALIERAGPAADDGPHPRVGALAELRPLLRG